MLRNKWKGTQCITLSAVRMFLIGFEKTGLYAR